MKNNHYELWILLVIVGMLISAGIVAAEQELGKWDGFRGIKWATNIKDVNDMVLVDTSDDENTTVYTRTTDKLSIGKAKLTAIAYQFYKDRFFSVTVLTEGSTNFSRLKEAIFAYYGEGTQNNQFIEEWTWITGTFCLVLKYNEFSEDARFDMIYLPIYHEREQDNKDAAEDAEGDF